MLYFVFDAFHGMCCQVILQAPADGDMLALALMALQRDSSVAHAAEVSTLGLRIFVVAPKRESAAQIEGMFKVSVRLFAVPACLCECESVCFFQESSSVKSASFFRNMLCAFYCLAQALVKGLPRCKTALLVGGVPQPPQVTPLCILQMSAASRSIVCTYLVT